jgi:hypothetical protein
MISCAVPPRSFKDFAKDDPAVVHSPEQKLMSAGSDETGDVGSGVSGWFTVNDHRRARRALDNGTDESRRSRLLRTSGDDHSIPRVLAEVQPLENSALRIKKLNLGATAKCIADTCYLTCRASPDGHGNRTPDARHQK